MGFQSTGPILNDDGDDGMIPQAIHPSCPASHDPKISQHGSLAPHKGATRLKRLHNKEQTGGFE